MAYEETLKLQGYILVLWIITTAVDAFILVPQLVLIVCVTTIVWMSVLLYDQLTNQ